MHQLSAWKVQVRVRVRVAQWCGRVHISSLMFVYHVSTRLTSSLDVYFFAGIFSSKNVLLKSPEDLLENVVGAGHKLQFFEVWCSCENNCSLWIEIVICLVPLKNHGFWFWIGTDLFLFFGIISLVPVISPKKSATFIFWTVLWNIGWF